MFHLPNLTMAIYLAETAGITWLVVQWSVMVFVVTRKGARTR